MQKTPNKVLVIDDEEAIRDLVSDMLSLAGYSVETAVNGREGLAKLGQECICAVVLDLWMPVMNGASTVIAIRQRDKTIPIILMTGIDKKDHLVATALQAGANTLLPKPFSAAMLTEILASLINQTRIS